MPYSRAMTNREAIIERIDRLGEAELAIIEKQLDALEGRGVGPTRDFTDMVGAIKAHNKDKDQADLQREIDEAVDAVRYQ